jgi:ABC-type thiamine transport system substrate-binding protein
MSTLMNAKDAVWAGMAEVYVTIDGNRYNLIQATKVEATVKKSKKDLAILGRTMAGHKAAGGKGSGKISFYYNTSIFRSLMKTYQDDGKDFYFDMTITNKDDTSSVGKQVVILKDCNLDETVVAKCEAGGDPLIEDASFTFESFELPTEFTQLDGMQ